MLVRGLVIVLRSSDTLHAMPRCLHSLPLLLGLALGACAAGDEEHVDTGRACVLGDPGQVHEVTVDFDLCLSSSCEEIVESSCTATLDGSTVTIEASATTRSNNRRQCTLDCVSPLATCQTPPLAEGMYTLVYGEDQVPLTVTADSGTTCTAMEPL